MTMSNFVSSEELEILSKALEIARKVKNERHKNIPRIGFSALDVTSSLGKFIETLKDYEEEE